MSPAAPELPDNRADQLRLLTELMNALAEQDVLSADTLRRVALDVMRIDYREDDDLLCFDCEHDDLHDF